MPLKSVVWSLVCTHANALHFVCIYYFLGSMRCARRSPNVLPAYIAPVEMTVVVFILNLTEMLISHTCLPEVNLRHVMMMSSSVFQTSNLRHLGSDISFCASFLVLRWGYFKILGKKIEFWWHWGRQKCSHVIPLSTYKIYHFVIVANWIRIPMQNDQGEPFRQLNTERLLQGCKARSAFPRIN